MAVWIKLYRVVDVADMSGRTTGDAGTDEEEEDEEDEEEDEEDEDEEDDGEGAITGAGRERDRAFVLRRAGLRERPRRRRPATLDEPPEPSLSCSSLPGMYSSSSLGQPSC